MRSVTFILVALIVSILPAPAQEEKLTRQQAKAEFEKADRALNDAWAAAKKALTEGEFNQLKEEQRAWVSYRDYLARSPMYTGAEAHEELAQDAPEYLHAAAGLEEMRTEWLKGLMRKWKPDETLTGRWTDSYGAHIDVVESEGHLHFVVQCVRGPTSHVGGLSGIASWNTSLGWFSDKGRDKGKTDETNLCFILRDRKLEVVGANTGYYHGMRAYFGGEYVKTGALSPQEQAKVMQAAKTGELPEE